MLKRSGFDLIRSKGSHQIYRRGNRRIVIPYHPGKTLHPKVVNQIIDAIEDDA